MPLHGWQNSLCPTKFNLSQYYMPPTLSYILCSTSFPTLLCPFPNNLCVPKPQNTPIPTPNPVPNYLNIRIFPGYVISPPIISTQTLIPLIKFNQIHQQITMLTHTLQVPQTCTIGRYQYLSSNIIGEGFYGKVYRGHRTADRKKVAVKIVNLEEHHDAEELEFIDNELKISQLLKHERVIDCLEIYKKSNKYYFVTELIEDGDLDRYIRERGQLDEGEALRLLKQIVSGMVYIKQKRVIHRDLKPANIFLKDGNVKIADFGLSAFVFGDKMVSESRIGSPRYMAPEVLHQGLYTYKCDVWSLGILFIEMVTGEAPFTDCESFEEIVEKVLQPVIPASLALSELAMEMLSSMLEVRQSKRISIQELQDHLIFNQISKHSSISTNASEDCGLEIQELSAISLPRSRISSFSTCFNQAMNESQIPQPQYEQIQPSYYLLTTSNISESKLEDRTNHSDWSEMVLKVEGVEEGQIRSGQNGYSGGERLSKMDSSDLLEFRNLLWNGVE